MTDPVMQKARKAGALQAGSLRYYRPLWDFATISVAMLFGTSS